jgi:hypothetical protein
MENLRELLSFFVIRALERVLPAPGLYWTVIPAAKQLVNEIPIQYEKHPE